MAVTIGERLRKLIEETGCEQKQIAERIGMKIPTFNGYVVNKREPNIATMIRIADFFKVSVDYLIGRSNIRDSYLGHLTDEFKDFVSNPDNKKYLELAKDIKNKTENEKVKTVIGK